MQFKPIITAILVLLLLVAASGCTTKETTKNESGSSTGNSNVDVTINSNHTSQSTKTGYQYLIFDVTVKNLNEKDLDIGNPNYFKLTTADGSVYEYSYLSSLSNAISSVSHTNPGEKVTGAVAFEIPKNAQPTKLQYNDYSNQVVINLTSVTSASTGSSVPSVSSEKTVGNKTIFTSSRGYSISYPKTLKTDYGTDPSAPVDLFIYLSSSSSVDSVVVGTENLDVGHTLQDFRTTNLNVIQKYTNYQELSSQTTTFAGNPAYKIVWQATVPVQLSTSSSQNMLIKSTQIFTINDNVGYAITYKAPSSEYDTYLAQAQQIIDSFKFTS